MTGVKLEKISDIDMYLLIKKGLRGETSYNAKRYSEASNKYMKNYDPTKLLGVIEYVDLEYPDELYVLHNGYLLAPGTLATSYDMLSNYCKKIASKYGIKVADVKKIDFKFR